MVSKGNTVNRVQQIKKILVAEDVESNFILLKNLIGREYTLLWAKDGVEAIEMYKQYQPDLIDGCKNAAYGWTGSNPYYPFLF